jgi:hypothetical protein
MVSFISSFTPLALPLAAPSSAVVPSTSPTIIPLSSHVINLSHNFYRLIGCISHSLIGIKPSMRFVVTDTGATDHMLPNKLVFISYKAILNLQVCRGSVVVSLNGQRILIHNALHIPSLVVPLYSLRAHLTQRG